MWFCCNNLLKLDAQLEIYFIKVIFLTLVKEIESCDYVHAKTSSVYQIKKGSDYNKVVLCEFRAIHHVSANCLPVYYIP